MDDNKTTHFGYEDVAIADKQPKVDAVFHSVAQRYDVMNDLMSFGIHRWWKKFTLNSSQVRTGHHVLDIAGGTGDLSKAFAKKVGKSGHVILADINSSMLKVGRERMEDLGLFNNITYVQANAECLPFADNQFDCISIAFGLRNVTRIDKALASMQRVLKPGGCLLVLEFSKPVLPGLSPIYDAYSFKILPWLGRMVTRDAASYQYLAESIRKHPDQQTLQQMMLDADFDDCQYHNLSGGIVALHKAHKY